MTHDANGSGRRIPKPAASGGAKGGEWRFSEVHPDPLIAREAVIDTLLGSLDEARRGLLGA